MHQNLSYGMFFEEKVNYVRNWYDKKEKHKHYKENAKGRIQISNKNFINVYLLIAKEALILKAKYWKRSLRSTIKNLAEMISKQLVVVYQDFKQKKILNLNKLFKNISIYPIIDIKMGKILK